MEPSEPAPGPDVDSVDVDSVDVDSVQEEMLSVTGTAWSGDRMVKVVVGPRGQLVDIEIDPRIYRKPDPKALAALIVATTRVAVERATTRTQEIIQQRLPQATDMLGAAPIPGVPIQRLMSSHDGDLRKIVEDDDADG